MGNSVLCLCTCSQHFEKFRFDYTVAVLFIFITRVLRSSARSVNIDVNSIKNCVSDRPFRCFCDQHVVFYFLYLWAIQFLFNLTHCLIVVSGGFSLFYVATMMRNRYCHVTFSSQLWLFAEINQKLKDVVSNHHIAFFC